MLAPVLTVAALIAAILWLPADDDPADHDWRNRD